MQAIAAIAPVSAAGLCPLSRTTSESASRPPGRSTRRNSSTARCWLGKVHNEHSQRTTSNWFSATGSVSASPWRNPTWLASPDADAASRAVRTAALPYSTPVAVAPNSLAANRVEVPDPQATSRRRWPAFSSASSNVRRVSAAPPG